MSRFFPNAKRSLDSLLSLITDLVKDGLLFFRILFRSRTALSAEVLFLRKQLDGYLSPGPNAPLLPAKLLGNVTADDGGTFTGSSTVMIGGGPPHTQTVTGTEQLNPDGTGTITYDQKIDNQQGPSLDITFIVSEKGDRIDGLATDPGTVFSCELRRTPKSSGDKD